MLSKTVRENSSDVEGALIEVHSNGSRGIRSQRQANEGGETMSDSNTDARLTPTTELSNFREFFANDEIFERFANEFERSMTLPEDKIHYCTITRNGKIVTNAVNHSGMKKLMIHQIVKAISDHPGLLADLEKQFEIPEEDLVEG
jgi:hypothetical protein